MEMTKVYGNVKYTTKHKYVCSDLSFSATLRFMFFLVSFQQEIASYMGLELGKINIKRFADGEIYVQLQESVRGCDVFLVQPSCPPANENLMELLIMIDACRRASAKNITAVIPYFGYARADRKVIILKYYIYYVNDFDIQGCFFFS
jgi:hypothetical protein